ncbi:12453_t:CDS:2 [Funneliformis geosporum]|uniref:ribonuclease III n=1 Tax=Funneliformis geosporum TaxID=1117311 RepID=A0A9W4SBF0_9GLOM|nr:12453_t:CDS:2 [Funneliformis geosporum]
MDWQRGAEFTNYYSGNRFQYRLYGKGKSFFKRLLGKPTIYYVVSPLEDHEIRNKEIEFEGITKKTGIKIPKTKFRGAAVPKGVLLVGPPGNGKTLLAKALAGECGLPFLARSGSDFEEMMVGVGARRVRDLFQHARSFNQGCIIFIDEIDSIGRKRYSSNTGHAEQTLNQLLSELDGFQARDNVIILAATNSLKVLDNALLRPGRFDRQIYIPLPNVKGRREIIYLHTQKLTLHPGINLEEIVSMTRGLSGAQIVNMFNEASILSIRHGKKSIDQEMLFEAYDRILMGPSLTSQTITAEKKKIVAFHEAGHAIVGLNLYGEEGDDYLLNKNQMLAHVMTSLGGRASEELIFGLDYITVGAYDDFKKASSIIRELILYYGMSDLGIVPTQESYFFVIAIVAAIIHTYGYSLIFRAQATPGENSPKMKISVLQKEITENLEKDKELEKERLNKEKKIEIREKNAFLTSIFKNKTGNLELENYPQEIDYYLVSDKEKIEKFTSEITKINQERKNLPETELKKSLYRRNDLEKRKRQLEEEQKRSIAGKYLSYITNNERLWATVVYIFLSSFLISQIFPRDQLVSLYLHSLTEENQKKGLQLLAKFSPIYYTIHRREQGKEEPTNKTKLANVKKIIESIRDSENFQKALTHVSYCNESDSAISYERLEFLGDEILNFHVALFIYHNFPNYAEGKMSKLQQLMVQESTLAELSREIGLNRTNEEGKLEYLRLGEGEMKNQGANKTSILADIFESFIAALYLEKDYKSLLQEYCQSQKNKVFYRLKKTAKVENQKMFTMEVKDRLGTFLETGQGHSKKEAEQEAAARVIKNLGLVKKEKDNS